MKWSTTANIVTWLSKGSPHPAPWLAHALTSQQPSNTMYPHQPTTIKHHVTTTSPWASAPVFAGAHWPSPGYPVGDACSNSPSLTYYLPSRCSPSVGWVSLINTCSWCPALISLGLIWRGAAYRLPAAHGLAVGAEARPTPWARRARELTPRKVQPSPNGGTLSRHHTEARVGLWLLQSPSRSSSYRNGNALDNWLTALALLTFPLPRQCFLVSPPKETTCTGILALGSVYGGSQTEAKCLPILS